MSRLSISLLGPYKPTLDDEVVSGFSSAKVRGLLAYLAVESERPHSRESLAGLLWPDEPHEVAHANLRQAIANLRQVLGDRNSPAPLLTVTRVSAAYCSDGNFVDVRTFIDLLARYQAHAHRWPDACATCAQNLQQAVDLYRGDFLEGLFLNDSAPFEEWALVKREQLRRLALGALYHLADYYIGRRDYENARCCAARQLELDPWREEAHRQMMQALALDGRRSEAQAQFERCRRALRSELDADPSPDTLELYRQIHSGTLTDIAPPSPRNWPAPVTSFVGRQRERAQLIERIQMPATRLVTLAGLGGAGKTRLALRVGEQLAPEFPAGACFVSLAGLLDAASISHAIAGALGYTLANRTDPTAELAGYLRRLGLLLILDNCEHEAGHAEVLDRLLRACPGLVVLATSRERLNLDAEWVFTVDGLSTPGGSAATGGGCDAVELFVERMRQVSGEAERSAVEEQAIARICDLVEGFPLAIEVAASWTKVMSCAEIAGELERDLGFLVSDRAEARDGQSRLATILDRAWALLPAGAQHVLCQLAVFQGGFRRQEAALVVRVPGAEIVADGVMQGPQDGARALDAALVLLIDRSLLRRTATGRYRQHTLVHRFAAQRLAEAPALRAAVEAGHALAYAKLLAAAATRLTGAQQQSALAELDADSANLQAAWCWAVSNRDHRLIALCIDALDSYYDLHSWSQEAVRAFEEAVEVFAAPKPRGEAEARVVGGLMARLAMHYYRLNQLEAAREMLDRCLQLLGGTEAPHERALALHVRGNIFFWQGDYAGAERSYTAALSLARRAGNDWLAAALTSLLGDCASIAADHPRAMGAYEESLVIFRELSDPRMTAVALSNLADGYRRQARAPDARPLYFESLRIAEKIGHRRLAANSLNGLGELAYDLGDCPEARHYYQASLDLCRDTGGRLLANLNLAGLGFTACMEGDVGQARLYLREALHDLLANQSWAVLPAIMIGVAHILLHQDGGRAHAVALLSQVLCHDISWEEYRNRAQRLLDALRVTLTPSGFEHALADAIPLGDLVRNVLGIDLPERALILAGLGCERP